MEILVAVGRVAIHGSEETRCKFSSLYWIWWNEKVTTEPTIVADNSRCQCCQYARTIMMGAQASKQARKRRAKKRQAQVASADFLWLDMNCYDTVLGSIIIQLNDSLRLLFVSLLRILIPLKSAGSSKLFQIWKMMFQFCRRLCTWYRIS